jgi:hypothetical protein
MLQIEKLMNRIILKLIKIMSLLFLMSLNQSCSVMCKGFGTGCEKEKAKSKSKIESTPAGSVSQPIAHGTAVSLPPKPKKDVIQYVPGDGFSLTRLTPEQFSHFITNGLGYEFSYTDPATNRKIDLINVIYGVSLGGIDFTSVSKRDLSIKAQTLLATRLVSWEMSRASVYVDLGRAENDRLLFTECKLETDRPFVDSDLNESPEAQQSIRDGEIRWEKQVESLFWRLYSRPATSVEINAVKTAFITSMNSEGYLPTTWLTVIYAMMSSQEFWNL